MKVTFNDEFIIMDGDAVVRKTKNEDTVVAFLEKNCNSNIEYEGNHPFILKLAKRMEKRAAKAAAKANDPVVAPNINTKVELETPALPSETLETEQDYMEVTYISEDGTPVTIVSPVLEVSNNKV